jgi:hypothetical protein
MVLSFLELVANRRSDMNAAVGFLTLILFTPPENCHWTELNSLPLADRAAVANWLRSDCGAEAESEIRGLLLQIGRSRLERVLWEAFDCGPPPDPSEDILEPLIGISKTITEYRRSAIATLALVGSSETLERLEAMKHNAQLEEFQDALSMNQR